MLLLLDPNMMSSTLMVLVSVTTMAMISGEVFAALPAQCNPGFFEELPPRLRKICVTIARIWDASDMNNFIDDKDFVNVCMCVWRLIFYVTRSNPLCIIFLQKLLQMDLFSIEESKQLINARPT
ncbi:myosuppressin isoform X2 [Odontomachus brunneus]|uniref:myosuppressin isoform X2 n=1 Tax=Odontomachus brunneus TaxID=486640 RepID=UPI0013F2196F|nr:myosuppressin isoform X2 [Odontomachus brunneus]